LDLKLALLSHEYPPYTFGGVGSFVHLLAEALGAQGVSVCVVAGLPAGARASKEQEKSFELPNVNVVRFPYPNVAPRHLWFQVKNSERIRGVFRSQDVVHGQGACSYPAIRASRRELPKVPWIVTFHSNPFREFRARATLRALSGATPGDTLTFVAGFPVWQGVFLRELALAQRAVTVSAALADEVSGFARGRRIDVVRNGVEVSSLSRVVQPKAASRAQGMQIVYAGRLYLGKGILALLDVMRILVEKKGLRDLRLLVFGKGPLEAKARRTVLNYSLQGNVEFMGLVPRSQVLSSIAGSDALALPSTYEANPIVALEAAALGKPVVAFNHPFSREIIVDGQTGFLANNEEDFADRIEQLYRSHDLGRRMGDAARLYALKNFDAEQMARRYLDIYLSAIHENPG